MSDRMAIAVDRLAELYFTMQQVRPAGLHDVEIAALDPFLRGLLFTDGTVTRALEVETLSPVAVDVVDQTQAPVPAQAARYLDVAVATECLRRRVTIRIAGTPLAVWAESHIVPQRLPAAFLGLLDGAPHGLGGSMQRLQLESSRELLWFGLGTPPHWARTAAPPPASASPPLATALIRLYRILTEGRPALLISEAFAVQMQAGIYQLVGSNGSAVNITNGFAPIPAADGKEP
jgi:chorismate-pyruvate lyase